MQVPELLREMCVSCTLFFRLIEKMATPFHGSRGKGIQPRSQEIFEDLGIVDRIMAAGGLYPLLRDHRADGSYTDSVVMDTEPATPDEPYHHALLVPQFLTERILRERLLELGHRPEYACELIEFTQDAEGVTARLTHTDDGADGGENAVEIVRARYLVGADGGRSFVRHALDIGFPGKTLGVRAVVADVMLTGLGRDAWHRFNEGSMEQQLGLCPLAGRSVPVAGASPARRRRRFVRRGPHRDDRRAQRTR
jgi:2-polyprenyl-6-methoxyphenol hydroxylase-like FAD-dependent oxidoreductase